jgi:hypothetical protein
MNRTGFALLLVLLVIAAIELLTLSTLTLATHEVISTAALERASIGSHAAESALRNVIRSWPIAGSDSLQVAQTITFTDSAGTIIAIRRNTPGQYQVSASAAAGRTRVREVALLEAVDAERGIAEANGVIVTRGPVAAPNARFLLDPTTCPLPTTLLAGDTAHLNDSTYAFAGLSWSELASVADSGLVYADHPYTIGPGSHTGIFAVKGNVTVQAGADLVGVVVTNGAVVVEDGVHIRGAVIVRGLGSAVVGAADLTYSPCAVAQVLQQTAAARRIARSSRRFLPVF